PPGSAAAARGPPPSGAASPAPASAPAAHPRIRRSPSRPPLQSKDAASVQCATLRRMAEDALPPLLDGVHRVLTPEYVEFDFVLAGLMSRFLAWAIDLVIVIGLTVVSSM